jgi:hypothetical protein
MSTRLPIVCCTQHHKIIVPYKSAESLLHVFFQSSVAD